MKIEFCMNLNQYQKSASNYLSNIIYPRIQSLQYMYDMYGIYVLVLQCNQRKFKICGPVRKENYNCEKRIFIENVRWRGIQLSEKCNAKEARFSILAGPLRNHRLSLCKKKCGFLKRTCCVFVYGMRTVLVLQRVKKP